MSKFKQLVLLTLKEETDWDDPTERYWDRSPVNVEPISNTNSNIKEKPINPVSNSDRFYIKAIVTNLADNKNHVFYLKANKPGQSPYMPNKENASKFKLQYVEDFIKQHDKKIITKGDKQFQLHFESEKV